MNEHLRALVTDRLSGAVNCPAKEDIIEEITADLAAKYADLLDCGMEPEAALAKVQEGIGDLSEVVTFINEANRRSEEAGKTSDNPFAGLEDLMRQMGKNLKNLEPSMREVANDLKSAAGHIGAAAKDLARESKDPLKEMAGNLKNGFKTTFKNLSDSLKGEVFRYDYTVPAAELNGVEVTTSSGDVTFGVSQDDNIYIVELSKDALTEDKLARIQVQGDTVTIAQGKKYSAGTVMFSYGMLSSDFEIYLPQRAWNSLTITTTSGDVELEKGLECAYLEIRTTSGDIDCPEVTAGLCELVSTSGDIQLSGECQQVLLQTVSGDCLFNGTTQKLQARSTSGDHNLRMKAMPSAMEMHTVSGDTQLYLPDNDGFILHYQRISGDVRSDFQLKTSLSDKSGTAVYLTGADRHYSMQTVSGDLRIYRR